MIDIINDIKLTNDFCVEIYNSDIFSKYFNDYNKQTNDSIRKIIDLYENNSCFKVPFIINELAWGYEKVYYPFTTSLIKILSNNIGRTSIQIHPLKIESWFALNDITKYYDGTSWNNLKKYRGIKIPANTIHSLERNSLVLEIQDNNLFDKSETIRIKDFLGRNVDKFETYLKCLIPIKKNKISDIKDLNYSIIDNNNDYLIFSFEDGNAVVYDDNEYQIEKNNLYFVKRGFKMKIKEDNIVYIRCEYFENKNFN